MSRQKIILSGRIGINQREDAITWEGANGTIQLNDLLIYLGETRPTTLPEEIVIVSHVTGVTETFRHVPTTGGGCDEAYLSDGAPPYSLVIRMTPEQILRMRTRAIIAEANGRAANFQ